VIPSAPESSIQHSEDFRIYLKHQNLKERPSFMADSPSTKRLIARVIRDILKNQTFEEYADFKDALRRRLSVLRIPYQPADFDDAITAVATNARIVSPRKPERPRVVVRPSAVENLPSLTPEERRQVAVRLRQMLRGFK
jgi:hypothetical protein